MSSRGRPSKVAAVAAIAIGGVVACSGSKSGSGASPGPACTADIDAIQSSIFVPKCAAAGCHSGSAPQAGVDLLSAGAARRLVLVPATQCKGKTLVVPGDPSASYLYQKVSGAPACGVQMPNGSVPLAAGELKCISDWIAGLAPAASDAGSGGPTTTCGAGLTSCASGCVDVTIDPKNCGACDHACPAACHQGQCVTSCPPPTTSCSGSCVDTSAAATLSAIQSQIFTPTCAVSSCHAPTSPEEGLDLTAGNAYANLVGAACKECPPKLRVAPGDVAGSYLMNKLTGVDMCSGSEMPRRDQTLPKAQIDMVRSWICSGAAND